MMLHSRIIIYYNTSCGFGKEQCRFKEKLNCASYAKLTQNIVTAIMNLSFILVGGNDMPYIERAITPILKKEWIPASVYY